MMKSTPLPIIIAVFFLLSCGNKKQAGGENTQSFGQPQVYPVQRLEPGTVILTKVYPVIIRGEEDIEIRPRVEGFIKRIHVDEGSVVKKGQTLFEIDSPSSLQALETARAAVESYRAGLNTARLDVERIRPLAEKGIISAVQLETYENQYVSAQAAYNQAQATLRQAEATMSWTRVSSPVNGVVGEIPYRQGSLVSSSNVLTTVANTSNVYAYFSLNEKELLELLSQYTGTSQSQKISNMPEVTLLLPDGTEYPFKGRIETISGVIATSTGTANLRAEFPNRNGYLRSGMSGNLSVPRRLENTIRIPQKATFSQQDKTLVYKVQADTVVQAIITVEPTPDGQGYAVVSGLKPDEVIVTDGVATLTNGQKIQTR